MSYQDNIDPGSWKDYYDNGPIPMQNMSWAIYIQVAFQLK